MQFYDNGLHGDVINYSTINIWIISNIKICVCKMDNYIFTCKFTKFICGQDCLCITWLHDWLMYIFIKKKTKKAPHHGWYDSMVLD